MKLANLSTLAPLGLPQQAVSVQASCALPHPGTLLPLPGQSYWSPPFGEISVLQPRLLQLHKRARASNRKQPQRLLGSYLHLLIEPTIWSIYFWLKANPDVSKKLEFWPSAITG